MHDWVVLWIWFLIACWWECVTPKAAYTLLTGSLPTDRNPDSVQGLCVLLQLLHPNRGLLGVSFTYSPLYEVLPPACSFSSECVGHLPLPWTLRPWSMHNEIHFQPPETHCLISLYAAGAQCRRSVDHIHHLKCYHTFLHWSGSQNKPTHTISSSPHSTSTCHTPSRWDHTRSCDHKIIIVFGGKCRKSIVAEGWAEKLRAKNILVWPALLLPELQCSCHSHAKSYVQYKKQISSRSWLSIYRAMLRIYNFHSSLMIMNIAMLILL